MPEAVTTQHETLWIGVNRSAMVRVPYVVSSPEIADPVQPIDATNLASDMKVYIPGIRDYSGDLVWEANSQYYRPGELRDLLAMDGCHVYAERRMPMVGMRVAVEGEASVSMSAADPDGVQRVTVRIAPTAPMSVEEWSSSMNNGYVYWIRTNSTGANIVHVAARYGQRPFQQIVNSSTRRQGAENIPEEWRFNGGVGPFGCFYAAFNVDAYVDGTESEEPICTEAGRIAYKLDPYNLKRTLAGTELAGTYNIMLVIPTVYWTTSGSDLYMSSSPSYGGISGMVAYAHTATLPGGGTKVYPYIAIGVYGGHSDGTRLLSASGKSMTDRTTCESFRALADALTSAGTSDFQQWNHYMWTLYKMMAYTVMGTKNSQWALGAGANAATVTGLSDRAGPYAASTTYSKMFIEDPWGAWTYVADAYFNNLALCAGNALGGSELESQSQVAGVPTIPSTGGGGKWIQTASTSAAAWDLPTSADDVSTADDPAKNGDRMWSSTAAKGYLVGGWSAGVGGGIGCLYAAAPTNYASTGAIARLSAYLDDYAMGLTDEAPAALMSAPLSLSMGLATPDEEEAAEPEEESAEPTEEPEENYGEEETPEETDTIEEDMR